MMGEDEGCEECSETADNMTGKWTWIYIFPVVTIMAVAAQLTRYLRQPHQEDIRANLKDHVDQLTVDEMKYAIFGEPRNSSFGKSVGYLNYVRSHIAKPSTLRSRVLLNPGAVLENSKKVDLKLKGRRNGFFIECGAADGHSYSHTAFLEMARNWTGLLVEANQRYFQTLLGLNRKAFVFGGCLSPERRPRQLQFHAAGDQGGLTDQLTDNFKEDINRMKSHESMYLVQCFPLNDILAAINIRHVDYFSLDVQGSELSILKTIDFHSIRIDMIILEVSDKNYRKKYAMRNDVRELFRQTRLYKEAEIYADDLLFTRLDV